MKAAALRTLSRSHHARRAFMRIVGLVTGKGRRQQ
jgi:hypothetical protein